MAVKQTECPFCGNPVYVDDQWAGIDLDCPFCQRVFTLPGTQIGQGLSEEKEWAQNIPAEESQAAYFDPASPFTALKKYANFRGRSSRREFWLFIIFCACLRMILLAAVRAFFPDMENAETVAESFCTLCFLLPFIAVSVRRLHDIGRSGWYFLLILIPCVGFLVHLIIMSLPSQLPDNEYGLNPNGFHPDKAAPVIAGWLVIFIAACF